MATHILACARHSLCAGIKNYCPDGIHLVIGDVPSVPFGAHPIGSEEFLSKSFLLSQLICACKVKGPATVVASHLCLYGIHVKDIMWSLCLSNTSMQILSLKTKQSKHDING